MAPEEPHPEEETITVHELLERSARAALKLQREDGSFPPGRNGVYDEQETPVRTTANWLTTLSKVYEITGDEVFAKAATDAADYLLSDAARPYGYTFHSREVEGKDRCDGLVGQAAPIRGLARSGVALNRPDLIEIAEQVFFCHPFDSRLGLWERVEIDGTRLSFDRTLNHQLTFAAASANFAKSGIGHERIERFLTRLVNTMRIHSDGLINHYVRPPLLDNIRTVAKSPAHWNLLLNEVAFQYYSHSSERRTKELGYHPINLRSLARLKESFPHHSVWDTTLVNNVVDFVDSERYSGAEGVMDISYGSMTPGIHTAYALLVLDDRDPVEIRDWLKKDIKQRFDFKHNLLVANAIDPTFQAATIFNAATLPDITITLP